MEFPILSYILLSPSVGVLILFLVPDGKDNVVRWVSLAVSLVATFFAVWMFMAYDRANPNFQFEEIYAWVPGLNSSYHVAVDGVGATLVLLNAIVMLTGVVTSWTINFRVKEYFILFLLLVAGVFGSFICLDFLLFFIFFEVAVLPMYLLIGIWGSTNREYAALKLTIMLLAGSGLVFVGLIMVYFTSTAHTFDFVTLRDTGFTSGFQDIVYPLMFLGFGTLAAVFPLHNWSPDGHVAAPTAVSMLHAGVLMKLGAYGVLRYGIELFPHGAETWAPVAALLAASGVVYGALPSYRSFAALNERNSTVAALRWSGLRYTLRLDIASPSGSRVVGQTTISSGKFRSRTICRMTAACWASFCPKYALCGWTALNNLATTVVTPRK